MWRLKGTVNIYTFGFCQLHPIFHEFPQMRVEVGWNSLLELTTSPILWSIHSNTNGSMNMAIATPVCPLLVKCSTKTSNDSVACLGCNLGLLCENKEGEMVLEGPFTPCLEGGGCSCLWTSFQAATYRMSWSLPSCHVSGWVKWEEGIVMERV